MCGKTTRNLTGIFNSAKSHPMNTNALSKNFRSHFLATLGVLILTCALLVGDARGVATTVVTVDTGSRTLQNASSVHLSVGSAAVNGDGAVVQIGYYQGATIANKFGNGDDASFVTLIGAGSALGLGLTIGDTPENGAGSGQIFADINVSGRGAGGFTDPLFPAAGTPLVVRFFSATTLSGSTHFEAVSSNSWVWSNPVNLPSISTVNMNFDIGGLVSKSGTNVSSGNIRTITPNPLISPSITTQPANQAVNIGQTATFSVVATGAAPLSYQWRKNAVNISGATNASYTTPATVGSDNGALFSVVVTNSFGSATSNNVTLSVILLAPIATAGPPTAVTTNSATLNGTVNPRGSLTTVIFEFGIDGLAFPDTFAATPATVNGNAAVPVSATVSGLVPGGTYYYRVKGTSAGGVGTSTAALLVPNIFSDSTQIFPGAPPSALASMVVNLYAPGISPGWHFAGEQQWRPPGVSVGGLTTGARTIEFQPVPGYIQPPPVTVDLVSGGPPVILDREYYEAIVPSASGLTMTLKPAALAAPGVPVATRAQWRLLGEDDAHWRDSGATLTGIYQGNYLVECKPVAGRNTPPPITVTVPDGGTGAETATYFVADAPNGTRPAVLSFNTVSTNQSLPFAYVGQLRSHVGRGSGFVAKPRVVATAAHLLFDDGTLSATTGLQWLLQRDRGTFEPPPQIPRGFYLLSGYAAQRGAENDPGTFSPVSQAMDIGALYFLEDVARGGSGGFLISDPPTNDYLVSSRLKILAGYPVDGIPEPDQGRMHATAAANINFTRPAGGAGIVITTDVTSSDGNTGGPVFVQLEDGLFDFAGIYFGGGPSPSDPLGPFVTKVSPVTPSVGTLILAADMSSGTNMTFTAGGIVRIDSAVGSSASFSTASLIVNILPPEAATGGAQWKLGSGGKLYDGGIRRDWIPPRIYDHGLIFTGAPYFITPPDSDVTLIADRLLTVNATFNGIAAHPVSRGAVPGATNVSFSATISGTPSNRRWRFTPAGSSMPVLITGAESDSYTLPTVNSGAAGTYALAVTWPPGGEANALLSNAATLTVHDITTHPASRTVFAGSNAPFSVTGSELSSISHYQWRFNGVPIPGPGTTLRSYTRPNVSNAVAGAYTVVVAWGADGALLSNPATLSVLPAPLSDPDYDGNNTLLEYALKMDPLVNDSVTMTAGTGTHGLPLIRAENSNGQDYLTVEYVRRKPVAGQPVISYHVEFTSNISNSSSWLEGGTVVVGSVAGDVNCERVKVTDTVAASPARYARLKVILP